MYRIATLNDMVELAGWKERRTSNRPPPPWGLKRFGQLLCERVITEHGRSPILEAGVGLTANFHELLTPEYEYWTCDQSGFYDADRFRESLRKRSHARHVDGVLGDFLPELPDDYFEVVFSISVLEHSPIERAPDICRDIWRALKPGGVAIHTIDTPAHQPNLRLRPWHSAFEDAGFVLDGDVDLTHGIRVKDGLAALVEPLDVRVRYGRVEGGRFWDNPHPIRDHQSTIAVLGEKPH
jgi:SAM-dependent methyltransferase